MTAPEIIGNPGKMALRETAYRFINAALLALLGLGFLSAQEVALWTELGIGTVTLIFAALYATSSWRLALYALIAPLSLVLGWYGIAKGVDWAIVAMAVAQALGITTAAAKVIALPKDHTRSPLVT